jgi:hypothetical protein
MDTEIYVKNGGYGGALRKYEYGLNSKSLSARTYGIKPVSESPKISASPSGKTT